MRTKGFKTFTITLLTVILALSLNASALARSHASTARSNPLAGVYHPWRLQILNRDMTASGTVELVKSEPDHDWHINLILDKKYAKLINAENVKWEHGELVVEVIPMDQPHITRPYVGERLTVIGAYVDDRDHGWREIHPAWIVNGHGTSHYTATAAAASVRTGVDGNKKVFGSVNANEDATAAHKPQTHSAGTQSSSGITLVSSDLNVSPGDYASVEIHTKPGATGSIEVDYYSGPSHASGLDAQTADSQGDITWTWKVGTRTYAGSWPVIITMGSKTLETHVNVR